MMFSDEASRHLGRYFEEMRASMAGSADDVVADVEQDVRDHIEAELADRQSPISAHDLDEVLTRLGRPAEWVAPAETHPPRALGKTEDWLAYGNIALLILAFPLPFLFPISWLLGRWALARAEQHGEKLGSRRWLLYSPLAIVSIIAVLFLMFWPVGAFAELGTIAAQRRGIATDGRFPPLLTLAVTFGCLGGYWIFLGGVCAAGQRAVRFLFHPFAAGFRRKHALWLSGAGAIVVALSAAAAFVGLR